MRPLRPPLSLPHVHSFLLIPPMKLHHRPSFSLQSLLKSGFSPTLTSIETFLRYLHRRHKPTTILHLYSQLDSNKLPINPTIHSLVSSSLLNLNRYEDAANFITAQISKSSLFPTTRTLDSLIRGFTDPHKALSILSDCLRNRNRHGAFPSPSALSSLIHRFVARGEMEKALEVLEMMMTTTSEDVNFVSSAVVSRFCRIGKPELALGFFETAVKSEALSPSVVTYTTIVTALCQLGRVDEVRGLVRRLEEEEGEGFEFDCVFYSNWIHGYLKGGALMDALIQDREMVEKGINRDVVSYSILIDWFSKEGRFEKAFGLLGKMMKEGIEPSLITFTAIMRGLCKRGRLEEAFRLFDRVLSMGMDVDEFVYVTLIDGVCRKGDLNRAFALLGDMEERGVKPSVLAYNAVINGLCRAGRVSEADEISKGVLGDVVTYTFLLIGAYGEAHVLYGAMPEMELTPDAVTYTTMIEGCCRAGQIEEALEVFDELRKSSRGITLNIITYNSLINGLCQQGCLVEALRLFDSLEKIGLVPSHVSYGILIDSLCKEGLFLDAEKFLDTMVCKGLVPNILIYNSMIDGYCKLGRTEDAVNVLTRKMMGRVTPDAFTVSSLIKGYSKRGDMEEALRVFAEFKGKNISADFLGFLYLIKGLCTKGRMEEARSVLREMLVSEPVIGLINRVDAELVESESVRGFLVELCEQGRVSQAVKILDEISSTFYLSGKKNSGSYQRLKLLNGVGEKEVEKEGFVNDFHSLHSTVSSLCSTGELKQANEFVMSVLSCMPK
ncbi:LOW QUALITY PROTEIN: hypothetical protein HID58_038503 [Brassica napus]|uniref:Uncharacterized protein n=1 Tax=Brassica napus TaxID=3708 RepID=A0ABQ8BPA8_BRANA|nr:LOW QUALITY PROTEIN: hypothetical protein HID58_038503 [Brassica napus]